MLQSSQEHPFLRVQTPRSSSIGAINIKIYDNSTLKVEMVSASSRSIWIFAEKSQSDNWMFSMWSNHLASQDKASIDQDLLTRFNQEYMLLFSACIKVIFYLHKDSNLLNKLQVCSHDTWIANNFLSEWRQNINSYMNLLEIVNLPIFKKHQTLYMKQ